MSKRIPWFEFDKQDIEISFKNHITTDGRLTLSLPRTSPSIVGFSSDLTSPLPLQFTHLECYVEIKPNNEKFRTARFLNESSSFKRLPKWITCLFVLCPNCIDYYYCYYCVIVLCQLNISMFYNNAIFNSWLCSKQIAL